MLRRSLHPLWGSLALDRQSSVSLQEQIARFFRAAISEGRMRGGMRVRSSRQFAVDFGISRTTAVEAYERLVEEGYLVTRPGAGVFVATEPPDDFRLTAVGRRPAVAAGVAPASKEVPVASFAKVDMRKYELPLAPGMPALDRFPWAVWTKLTNRVCRERPLNALGYGDPQGELALREAI